MAQSLLKSGAYIGYNEGHLLPLAQHLLESIGIYFSKYGEDAAQERNTSLSHAPYTYMAMSVKSIFIDIAREMYGQPNWLDKTPRPEMTFASVLLSEIWPNAKFIFMKRRGIENLMSRARKFPNQSFSDHCEDWKHSMEAWLSIRDLLAGRYMEIDQRTLLRNPEAIVQQLAEFLGLSAQQQRSALSALIHEKPEVTAEISDHDESVDISDTGWTATQIRLFRQLCGPMMAAFGYTYTATYSETR